MNDCLLAISRRLLDHFGPLHWWPAETPFEVVVGAILTQNTAWRNVEYAIANLRRAGRLEAETLLELTAGELETLIRPAGFFRQKTRCLQGFVRVLVEGHGGDLDAWLAGPLATVRRELLALPGIGPETADSILLYAGNRATFVVDAYTRRLFSRLGLLEGHERYDAIRDRFMQALPTDAELFNEYHALIVETCKVFCRKAPLCPPCPLRLRCPFSRQA
jgi:endonuclease III related protein